MMIFDKVKSIVRQCFIFYLIGFAVVLGIKYFYSKSGSNDLKWILAPTAWWVRTLSGITFEYEPKVGYVNHFFRFIIAPSCSGVQFMMITIATLIFSFVHRMRTMKRGMCWIVLSLGVSYLITIFVNGFRIVLAIYLPVYLHMQESGSSWLTQERFHTMIGIVVYFTSLIAIYYAAGYITQKMADMPERIQDCAKSAYPEQSFLQIIRKFMPPMFWYFSFALGIPFLNRAYKGDSGKFMEFAMLITVVCLVIIFLFGMVFVIRNLLGKRRKFGHK